MEIHRTVDGKTYSFELSPEELRMAYNEMEDTYMRLDIDSMLDEAETIKFRGKDIQSPESLSTELFKGSERFYNDIIFRKEKMDSHVEDFQYAMEDVLSENGSDYIKLIIKEQFADKDLFFLDPNGDIRWVTYNPDSSAGGQFIDITFAQDMLREAYASEEKIDEYILSRRSASLIDANTAGFINYADCIAQRVPDWNDFDSVINDIIHTKKEDKLMDNIEKGNKEQSAINAWHQLGDAYVEAYDEIHQPSENAQGKFQIYQLPSGDEYHYIRFEGMKQLKKNGVQLNHDDYELVYEGLVGEFKGTATLEAIYAQFNTERPVDFTGHSLSVSDVVVIETKGRQTAYYCDTIGFVEMPEFFLEKEIGLRDIVDRFFSSDSSVIETPDGEWRIANGGYDLVAEIYHNNTPVCGIVNAVVEYEVEAYQGDNDVVKTVTNVLKNKGFEVAEKVDEMCAIAEYKNGNRGPYSNTTNSINAGHSQAKAPVIYKPTGRR